MNLQVMQKMNALPGPRYKSQGIGSGEEFRETHLIPAFDKAVRNGEKLYVNMDGARYGYPTSFLEEAFSGLAHKRGLDAVRSVLIIQCTSEPLLVKEIEHYIENGNSNSVATYELPGD